MIFFIITTCVFNNCFTRQEQYITGITKLKQSIKFLNISNYKIIIVENNGKRPTYLDNLGCEVFYTNNNFLSTENKGIKELRDILDVINYYNIRHSDFIVKMTGRYKLEQNSKFMYTIKNLHNTNYDCILRYGSYIKPVNYKMNDCITGLIGMSCFYIKQIEFPNGTEPIEWNWAKITYQIEPKNICILDLLGIQICPGNMPYFLV